MPSGPLDLFQSNPPPLFIMSVVFLCCAVQPFATRPLLSSILLFLSIFLSSLSMADLCGSMSDHLAQIPPDASNSAAATSPVLWSLQSLWPVELTQLVLQFLEPKSKLHAARCSQTMRLRASAPFAWKNTPLRLRVDSDAAELVLRLNSSALLQHAPLHLVYNSASRSADLSVLASVSHFPRLHTLEVFDAALGPVPPRPAVAYSVILRANRVALLRLPAVQGVQSLITRCAFNSSCLYLLSQLPALRSLEMSYMSAPGLHATLASSSAQLTSLRLAHSDIGAVAPYQCRYVRFLFMSNVYLAPNSLLLCAEAAPR